MKDIFELTPYIIFLPCHVCDLPACFVPGHLICSHGYQTLVLQLFCLMLLP